MVTTALANILMTLVYFAVDVKEWWAGEPFFYAGNLRNLTHRANDLLKPIFYVGMNSIVLYLGHFVGWQFFPFNFVCGSMHTHWANLWETVWGTSLWLLVAFTMYKKKTFIVV